MAQDSNMLVYFILVTMNVALHLASKLFYSCEKILVIGSVVLLLRPLSAVLQDCVITAEARP